MKNQLICRIFDELKKKMSYRFTPVYKDTNSSEPLWGIRDKDFEEVKAKFLNSDFEIKERIIEKIIENVLKDKASISIPNLHSCDIEDLDFIILLIEKEKMQRSKNE